jgi:hypothetical protein
MAIYYAYGNALVDKDEIHSKIAEGKIQSFERSIKAGTRDARLEFSNGAVDGFNLLRSTLDGLDNPIAFEEIAFGKPLTIQIRHVYTGDKAEGFWGSKDMLVASAMRSIAVYDASPRAINFLVQKAKNNRNFRTIDATNNGSSLICYSPALAQSSSAVTVEVMFSSFPTEAFSAVSQAFSTASSIPVFLPASGYLVAAGVVTKLLGTVGKSLSDGTPALKRTEEVTFVNPGSEKAFAHFALLISDEVTESTLREYKVGKKGALVKVVDEESIYDGEHPYVVISMDGRANDDFKSFAPTAASAALLDKFYAVKDGNSQVLGALVDGLKLYNDMRFRDKAVSTSEKLKSIADKESKEYKDLLSLYNAYVANIGTKELLPTDPK